MHTILEMVGCMRFFLKDAWLQPRGKNTLSVLKANEPVHLKMSVGYLATMSTLKSSATRTTNNTRKCWSGGASSIQKSSIPKRHPKRCNVEWLKAKMRISHQQSYNSIPSFIWTAKHAAQIPLEKRREVADRHR